MTWWTWPPRRRTDQHAVLRGDAWWVELECGHRLLTRRLAHEYGCRRCGEVRP